MNEFTVADFLDIQAGKITLLEDEEKPQGEDVVVLIVEMAVSLSKKINNNYPWHENADNMAWFMLANYDKDTVHIFAKALTAYFKLPGIFDPFRPIDDHPMKSWSQVLKYINDVVLIDDLHLRHEKELNHLKQIHDMVMKYYPEYCNFEIQKKIEDVVLDIRMVKLGDIEVPEDYVTSNSYDHKISYHDTADIAIGVIKRGGSA